MVAHDVDRLVSSFAKTSWDRFIHVTASGPGSSSVVHPQSELSIGSDSFCRIWGFLQRTILDPGGVYLNINPPQPVAPPPVSRKAGPRPPLTRKDSEPTRAKGDEDEESELDRKARLRIGALGAAEWVLRGCNLLVIGPSSVVTSPSFLWLFVDTQTHLSQESKAIESMISPLDNAALWSSLHFAQAVPFLPPEIEGFGWNQPGVRKAAWSFLLCLLRSYKGDDDNTLCPGIRAEIPLIFRSSATSATNSELCRLAIRLGGA